MNLKLIFGQKRLRINVFMINYRIKQLKGVFVEFIIPPLKD